MQDDPGEGNKTQAESKPSDEPELKLPKWIKEDPTAGDKGKLLYVEEWAKKGRFKNPWRTREEIFAGIWGGGGLIGVGIMIGFERMSSGFFDAFLPFITFFLLGIFIVWLQWNSFKNALRRMPFCIYVNGFSRPFLKKSELKKRCENFVTWSQLEKMRLKDSVKKNSHKLTMTFYSEQYDSSITLSVKAMKALIPILKDQISDKFSTEIPDE